MCIWRVRVRGAWRDFLRAPRSQLCKNPDVAAEARQQARVAADKEERAREAKGDGAGHGQGRHPDAEGGESAGYGRLYDRVWAPPPAAGALDERGLESFLDDQPLGWHEPSLHALYATRYNVEAAKKLSRRNGYAAAHGSPIVPWPREDTVRFAEVGLGASKAHVIDVWSGQHLGTFTDEYTAKGVAFHDTAFVTLTPA